MPAKRCVVRASDLAELLTKDGEPHDAPVRSRLVMLAAGTRVLLHTSRGDATGDGVVVEIEPMSGQFKGERLLVRAAYVEELP